MPRKELKAKPRHRRPDLVDELFGEMIKTQFSETPDAPTVYEEEQSYGGGLHVTVLWTKWEDVPHEERGAVILDAYEKAAAKDPKLQEISKRITMALGVTPHESKVLKLDL